MILENGVESIFIFIAIQDVKSPENFNVFLVEARKHIATNKLLIVYLKKEHIHLSVSMKKVYSLMRGYKFELCVSSIKNLTKNSKYLSIYGYKYEHEMISEYIENFNIIRIEGVKSQKLNVKKEIFLLDTDSQSNKWKWDIYSITPTTIAMMIAIRFFAIRKNGKLLDIFKKLES